MVDPGIFPADELQPDIPWITSVIRAPNPFRVFWPSTGPMLALIFCLCVAGASNRAGCCKPV